MLWIFIAICWVFTATLGKREEHYVQPVMTSVVYLMYFSEYPLFLFVSIFWADLWSSFIFWTLQRKKSRFSFFRCCSGNCLKMSGPQNVVLGFHFWKTRNNTGLGHYNVSFECLATSRTVQYLTFRKWFYF